MDLVSFSPCKPAPLPVLAQGGDVDAQLTRLGNVVEEALSSPALDGADFETFEDLVAACRQVASLQPDGTRQPAARCEGVAALLLGMLEAGQGDGPLGSARSSGGSSGLSPEAEAYAQRVLALVRHKLGELQSAMPGRMSEAGSGGMRCVWRGRAAAHSGLDRGRLRTTRCTAMLHTCLAARLLLNCFASAITCSPYFSSPLPYLPFQAHPRRALPPLAAACQSTTLRF